MEHDQKAHLEMGKSSSINNLSVSKKDEGVDDEKEFDKEEFWGRLEKPTVTGLVAIGIGCAGLVSYGVTAFTA